MDATRLEEALQRVAHRWRIVRAGVTWTDMGPTLAWCPPDELRVIRHTAHEASSLERISAAERRNAATAKPGDGFRLAVVAKAEGTDVLLVTFSRALMDHGTAGLLLRDLAVEYRGGAVQPRAPGPLPEGKRHDPDDPSPDRDSLLAGLDLPTPLPLAEAAGEQGRTNGGLRRFKELDVDPVLPPAGGPGGSGAAASFRWLLPALWSVVLRRLSGTGDAVFSAYLEEDGAGNVAGSTVETLLVVRERMAALSLWELCDELRSQGSAGLGEAGSPEADPGPGRAVAESGVMVEAGNLTWRGEGEGVAPLWERSHFPVPVRIVLATGMSPRLRIEYDPRRLGDEGADTLLKAVRELLRNARARTAAPALHLPLARPASVAQGPPEPAVDFLDRVEAQIRQNPEATALLAGDRAVSYGELDRAARRLTGELVRQGVSRDSRVGVHAERRPEVVAAVLAILRAGGAYVPLDPSYPQERVRYMLDDSRAELLVSSSAPSGGEAEWVPLPSLSELLEEGDDVASQPVSSDPGDLAYVIYTSGSTGRPKGVAMVRGALSNLIAWQCETSSSGPGDRTLQFASLSFDVSFQEIFATLGSGGTLVLVDEPTRTDPVALLRHIRDTGVARLFLPFVALQQLADAASLKGLVPHALREVFVAGEQLRITDAVRRLFEALPGCVLENQYGPAETHVVTWHRLSGPPSEWPTLPPIGVPLPGTEILLLDPWGHPVPDGASGEIFIGGTPLARGYLDRPDLTGERFPDGGWAAEVPPGRRYRTGDLGRMGPSGVLEFAGRVDQQVKIRGVRVEPGEVEAALEASDAVDAAAVVARTDAGGSAMLVGYVVPAAAEVDGDALRRMLAESLPAAMVPSRIVSLPRLPTTPSGKIDRRTLMEAPLPGGERVDAPRTPGARIDQVIAGAWARVLQLDDVPHDRTFFDLGGTSLLMLPLAAALQDAVGREVSVTELFEHATVAAQAAHLGGGGGGHPEVGGGPEAAGQAASLSSESAAGGAVAVIGMYCRLPGSDGVEAFWRNLLDGVDGIRHFTREELLAAGRPPTEVDDPDYVRARGMLEGAELFDAAFFGYSPREAALMDPQHRLFLEACWSALEDAGYAPDAVRGRVGVWGGMSTGPAFSPYLLANLIPSAAVRDHERVTMMMGNGYDYLTTRVSYKLNLKGPSVTVQTACSTSLVAVCEAVDSLRRGRCDVAVAGGVSVAFPQRAGYFFRDEAGIESSDGQCRPFDAGAEGTVFGDGVATLVLKRLDAALADGDPVHAVILGVGLNNDGAGKVSFSAPSVEGQASAIRDALRDAGAEPESLGYVEAHGTATQLGDPIEVEGLVRAFGDTGGRTGFCALGSVKSNIGHTVAAAGAASLIKTCLALREGIIPRTLHFQSPNARIDFQRSPFFVASDQITWPLEGPRRAGVSSFGFGGTNAHVIVQEPPERAASGPGRRAELILLSARDEGVLADAGERLAAHLEGHPELSLADVAHTTRVGRSAMPFRRGVVARDHHEAAAQLRDLSAPTVARGHAAGVEPGAVFLFPGAGAQYLGMGRDLYETEPVFRDAVDQCADLLGPELDLVSAIRDPGAGTGGAGDLERPSRALPFLFSVEYAVGRLLLSWGIRPAAVFGHSAGEYAAMCLAEGLSLADALTLVTARGRLFETLPPGGMTAVPAAEEEVRPFLTPGLSVAVVNGPQSCVVSGPVEEVADLEERLAAVEIEARRVHIEMAAHSAMVDEILAPFRAVVERVTLRAPTVPYISSVTGTWATAEELTRPDYWVRHLRDTVRFSAGLATVDELERYALLEVGPGRILTSLARVHPAIPPSVAGIPFMRHPKEEVSDDAHLARAVGRAWAAGVRVDWDAYAEDQHRRRVSLPPYPFRRDPHIIEPAEAALRGVPDVRDDGTRLMDSGSTPEEGPGAGGGRARVPRRDVILGRLREILAELSGVSGDQLDPDSSFLDMGFDSLFLTQASLGFKREFGIRITFQQLFDEAPTLNALAAYIDARLGDDVELDGEVPVPAAAHPAGAQTVPSLSAVTGSNDIQQLLAQHLQSTTALLAALSAPGAAAPPSPHSATPSGPADPAPPSHGPFRRLERERVAAISEAQQAFIAQVTERYVKRTAGSKKLVQENRDRLADPRAVAGFRRDWKELVYPIAVDRSKGSRMWDVDGNEYVDAVSGFGAILFGHAPDFVVDAVRDQLGRNLDYGPYSATAGAVARHLCSLTGMERAAFCNTGSEAVMAALRCARTATGRDLIAAFSGSYHGIFDEVLLRRQDLPDGTARNVPVAPGIPGNASASMLVLDYGDPASLERIRERAGELAGILVEPVQSRRPELQPREFLQRLRDLCTELEIPLIFDEVITGFRVHPRGAQGWFDVPADIATYGKVIGGGLPIGAVAGKALYLDSLDGGSWGYGDDSFPTAGVTYFAGTFIRHPLALAAVRACLSELERGAGSIQRHVNGRTARLAAELNDHFDEVGVPLRIVHFGSVFLPRFQEKTEFEPIFHRLLHLHGLHLWEGRPGFLTTAHSDEDVDRMIHAFKAAAGEMLKGGLVAPVTSGGSVASPGAGDAVEVELTEPQTEIWLAAQVSDDAARAFNESLRLDFVGPLNRAALERAARRLVARHEALRATVGQDRPTFRVHPRVPVDVPFEDLSQLEPAERNARLERKLLDESGTLFDFTGGPLVRFRLFGLGEDRHAFVMTVHHIVCDGWSVDIAIRDLSQFYNEAVTGRPAQLGAPLQLRDYNGVYRERRTSDEVADMQHYWSDLLTPAPEPLDLPTDRPRPPTKTYRGARAVGSVSADVCARLKTLSAERQCTLFTTMLGGFLVLLHKLSGSRDLVVGVPAAGQALLGENSLVAHCVNFLPVRSGIHPDEAFGAYLQRLRRVVMEANENQEFAYGRLLETLTLPRDPSRVPLVSASFNLDPAITGLGFHGLEWRYVPVPRGFSKLDVDLNVMETPEGGLLIELDHNTDLIGPDTASRWIRHYARILEQVAGGGAATISELDLVGMEDQAALIAGPEEIPVALPRTDRAEDLFLSRAKESPETVAMEFGDRHLTYGELEEMSGKVARGLRGRLSGSDPLVGVLMDRTPEMVATLLGVWRAGGAYVPLDPDFPGERLRRIMDDAGLSCVVTDREREDLGPTSVATIPVRDLLEAANGGGAVSGPPSDLAYVIYTSGSTGQPKGVEIPHGAVVNLLRSMAAKPGMGSADRHLAVTTISFDISVLELFLPLSVGGRVILADQETSRDGTALMGLLESATPTVMQATPTQWGILLEAGWKGTPGLRILAGGEPLPRSLADRLLSAGAEVWNMYGPTETTVWSTCHRVTPGAEPMDGVRIGRPILGTTVLVLDEHLRPVAPGVSGELCIGGAGLARGYRNRPDLTEDRFVELEWGGATRRLYRTGDVVRYRAGGELEFVGRSDRQVKLRGHRIELGDVEAALDAQPEVARSFARVIQRGESDVRLVAYVTGAPELDASTFRDRLHHLLPGYMIPQAFVALERFPLTANGKVDPQALPDPFTAEEAETGSEGWGDAIEEAIADAWADALGRADFGRHDDFFDLGGHSVLATRVVGRLRLAMTPELSLRDLFTNPTVSNLAGRVRELQAGPAASAAAGPEDSEEFVL